MPSAPTAEMRLGDLYYPWTSGTTGTSTLNTWDTYSGYYNDYYGDGIFAVNEDWDFPERSTGVGTVNTTWANGVPTAESFNPLNRDYEWNSNKPLEIKQSPHVDVLNCQMWIGDNWAPSEWRTPIVSNPASPARDETMTYYLPAGVPDPATPLENWPYNPQPTAAAPPRPRLNAMPLRPPGAPHCSSYPGTGQPRVPVETAAYKVFLPGHDELWSSRLTLSWVISWLKSGLDKDEDGLFDELIVTLR